MKSFLVCTLLFAGLFSVNTFATDDQQDSSKPSKDVSIQWGSDEWETEVENNRDKYGYTNEPEPIIQSPQDLLKT